MVSSFRYCVPHSKHSKVPDWWIARCKAVKSLTVLCFAVTSFEKSLYHQKHAFYFRKVKQWTVCLSVSTSYERKIFVRLISFVEWLATYRKWGMKASKACAYWFLIMPVLSPCSRPVKCLEYIFNDLMPELEDVMLGVNHAPGQLELQGSKLSGINAGHVAEELKTFGKECK